MPWIFVRTSEPAEDALPVTASSAEFSGLCMAAAPSPLEASDQSVQALSAHWLGEPAPERTKRRLLRGRARGASRDAKAYFEVPPDELGKDVEEIIPLTGSAQVLSYRGDTTVLRLLDTLRLDQRGARRHRVCQSRAGRAARRPTMPARLRPSLLVRRGHGGRHPAERAGVVPLTERDRPARVGVASDPWRATYSWTSGRTHRARRATCTGAC